MATSALYFYTVVQTAHIDNAGVIGMEGPGGAVELMVGATVGRKWVFGGALMGAFAPNYTVAYSVSEEAESNRDLSFGFVGAMVDLYTRPQRGFHLQGLVGAAAMQSTDAPTWSPAGVAFFGGIGHDWWIDDQWSVGLLGRMGVASLRHSEERDPDWTFLPSIAISGTYH